MTGPPKPPTVVQGQTLHSAPGPGIPKGTTEQFGNMKGQASHRMLASVRCLVVDEISMVDAEFLDWYVYIYEYVYIYI